MKGRILLAVMGLFAFLFLPMATFAQITPAAVQPNPYIHDDIYGIKVAPIPCNKTEPTLSCPTEFIQGTYSFQGKTSNEGIYGALREKCAESYEQFLTDPINYHYWVEDPKITEQGKADDRARQFLYWVLTTNAVDEAPVLRTIWNTTSLIAFFGVIIVAAVFGIGYIISRRTNYNFNIQIWPTLIKIGSMLLYIAFSAAIVFLLIQLSEILMKFFIENLGGDKLFNIYFTNSVDSSQPNLFGQTEKNYIEYYGCRDLNIRVQEAANSEVFLLKLTNVTYYTMGAMLLLRKILLWFLFFVAPFLALLMPFVFIRNVGWIWIGVFFQWLFYGPLLALFLGATGTIWQQGIPFQFDFSRVHSLEGYVYPTAIRLLYGGPAQTQNFSRELGALNNGNYVDTFAEYVITLIMLWAVTFFPWWLLRIFRDYCCEGIYAMKNILLAMYDQMRSSPPTGPSPTTPGPGKTTRIQEDTPIKTEVTVSLGSLEKMKKMMSKDIAKNLNLQATKITDIARLETNKVTRETTRSNIAYLANPIQATIPAKRQEFMNLRSELFNRAIKNDTVARSILSSTSTSVTEKTRIREQILGTLPKATSLQEVTGTETHISKETVNNITNNYTSTIVNNNTTVQHIANVTNSTAEQVKNILNSYSQNTTLPPAKVTAEIAKQQNVPETMVKHVLDTARTMGKYSGIIQQNAVTQRLPQEQVAKIVDSMKTAAVVSTEKPEEAKTSVVKIISYKSNVSADASKHVVQNILNEASKDTTLINNITNQTGLKAVQVQNVLKTFTQNVDKPAQTIVDQINTTSGIPKDKVQAVLKTTSDTVLSAHGVVAQAAKQAGVTEEQVAKTMQTQLQVATKPEDHIEQTIAIPSTISIEDYEQVKEMWVKQYESGEIPVSDQIKTRKEWVEQETVYITNTLNKVLSSDEKLRQDGLDELGYLLPIFLINSLKGEELVVYLKAKLEAAKSVQKLLEKEESMKEKLEKENEDDKVLVDVENKKEEEKTMEINMEDENEKTPQSIEDRTQAVQEKLENIQQSASEAPPFPSLDEIKNKLQQQGEKPQDS